MTRNQQPARPGSRGLVDLDYALCLLALLAGLGGLAYCHYDRPATPVADSYVSASPGPMPVAWKQACPTCTHCGCELPCGRDCCSHCGCRLDWQTLSAPNAETSPPGPHVLRPR